MKTINLILISILIGFLFSFNTIYGQTRKEIGNLILEDIPEIPDNIKVRIQQYQNSRAAHFQDWMPGNNGVLISTRFGNTEQLHVVNQPKGARNQITFFEEPVTRALVSKNPNYKGLLFLKDTGGNEFDQIYWYDFDKGISEMISDGKSVNSDIIWSNNGDKFAFASTRRNNVDFDIYISDISNPKETKLILDKGSGFWWVADWSLDDSKLVVIQYLSVSNINSFIFDLKSNELSNVNDDNNESVFLAEAWNSEGNKIFAITNEKREFNTLVEYDLKSKKIKYLTEKIPWDVVAINTNYDKTKLAFVTNENGYSRLYIMNTETHEYQRINGLPEGGQIYSVKFHPNKDEIAVEINSTTSPGDVYSVDIENNQITRWTSSEVGGLNTDNFSKPELIEYETWDEVEGKNRKIPAFIFKPSMNKEKQYPVLILIHGGPESQYVPEFSPFYSFPFITYLVNELEIAVIAPNIRGSAGYGKNYLSLDNGVKRENSVLDIGSLINWIDTQPNLDSDKIAVCGASYGGYVVLSSMFHFNDKLKCGIDIVGISNFNTFLKNTEPYRQDLRRVEYGDERNPQMREFLESISPTNHAHKIKKPLFVIQGANDPRVPMLESEQMVKSIRKNGGTVWYMLAKDEGHGFYKKENVDKMYEAITLFLNENLIK